MQKVELVARTTEVGRLCTADPESLNRDMVLLGGKAAGVCYMPDDYFEEGIQNEEKAVTRAGNCKFKSTPLIFAFQPFGNSILG